jgi:N-acetylmuramoyl-L-alanine amidase
MARIIIDAGHGGSTRAGSSSAYGSRGPSGLLEKDVTLDIARHVVARLGENAALTRTGDANLSLGARAAHASRDGADVFVSIHANSGPPEVAGPETWVHPDAGPGSHQLAEGIQRALEHLAGRHGAAAESRRGPMAVLSPGVLGHRTAACLVEVDYLSNPRGERRLGDPGERAAIGAAIAGAIREHLGRAEPARALSNQSFDIRYFVGLIPQPTGMSCWAASAAMMVSWREQMSRVDSAEVARGAGRWAEYQTGLNPHDVGHLATAWGLIAEPPQSYTVEGLRRLLETRGPLWIGEAVPRLHAIVITGIYGDGTTVIIKDPWPPGTGAEYEWTFRRLMQAYEAATQFPAVNIQILHNGGRGPVQRIGGPSGIVPSGYTTGAQIQWDQINQLRSGLVVDVQIRGSGIVEQLSHAYPLDVRGRIRIPSLGQIDADGLTLQQLGSRIQAALAANGILTRPTVNVTLKHMIVSYGALVTYPRVHVRVLDGAGNVEAESGWYPVRDDGTLNLPYIGAVAARGRRLDELEADIETGFQRYIISAVVHVTAQNLDA